MTGSGFGFRDEASEKSGPEESPLEVMYVNSITSSLHELFFRSDTTDTKRPAPVHGSSVTEYEDWDLDERVYEFCEENKEKYIDIIRRLDGWFFKNRKTVVIQFFYLFKTKEISFADFKKFLADLHIPATFQEMHMVCLLLDTEKKKTISIWNFETRLEALLKAEEKELANQFVLPDDERFVLLRLYSHDLRKDITFQGHMQAKVSTKSTQQDIVDVLNDNVKLIYRNYTFYRKEYHVGFQEFVWPPNLTLEEFGIVGGPEHEPTCDRLYYTYDKAMEPCPILRYVSYNTAKRCMEKRSGGRSKRKSTDAKKR